MLDAYLVLIYFSRAVSWPTYFHMYNSFSNVQFTTNLFTFIYLIAAYIFVAAKIKAAFCSQERDFDLFK